MELYDKDGNAIDVPVEKLEDITALKDKASKVDELEKMVKPDIRNMRAIIDDTNKKLKDANERLKAKGEKVDEDDKLTAEKVAEITKSTLNQSEAEKTERRRVALLDQLSAGDDNKRKVLEEKWNIVSGGKQITDPEEMQRLMDDAHYLSKKTNENSGHIPFSNMSGGSPAGSPQRGDVSGDKGKAVSNLEAMGYKFRSDKSKLTQ